MAARYANSYVKKIPGAQEGVAVDGAPSALPLGYEQILAQEAAQAQQAQQFDQTTSLINLLAGLDQYLAPQQVPDGGPGAGPVMDVMAEQRARAGMARENYNPQATYLGGMNPGGLFDSISSFIGSMGAPAPQMEMGQRLVNRTSMGSPSAAAAFAEQIAAKGYTPQAQPQTGPYASILQALLAPLIEQAMAGEATGVEGAEGEAAGGADAWRGPRSPSMSNFQQYENPVGPQSMQSMADDKLGALGGGVSLEDLVNLILRGGIGAPVSGVPGKLAGLFSNIPGDVPD